MKPLKIISVFVFFLFVLSFHSFAVVQQQTVSAPVDGGLLAILAGAGVVWFVARKKKNKSI